MKSNSIKLLLIILLFLLAGKTSFAQWQQVNALDTFPRARPATFVIKDTAYLGNGDNAGFGYTQDFRGYTQNTNTWVETRTYPGGGGDWGIRFQIGDTAYIGGGANPGWQNDFWKYDPKNGWKSLGTTPNGMHMGYNAAFVIGNKAYVGTGDNSGPAIDSFWEYDPVTNVFTTKAPFPANRQGCAAFAANGYGYVGLGGDGSGTAYKDMYRYNPVADKWDTMASMPTAYGMEEPGFFVICGKLFVTMGDSVQSGTSTSRQTWLFDPYNGTKGAWYRLPDYPGPLPSYAPAGFVMHDTGFIYGGWNQPHWSDRGEMYRFLPTRALMHMLVTPLDTTICAGSSITLRGTSSLNYLWNTGDTTANITVTPSASGKYIVTETSGGCIYLDTVNVIVNSGSAFTVSPKKPAVCSGQDVVLYINGSGTNYTWSPPAGLNVTTGDTVSASPTVTTTYIVNSGSGGSCSFSDTVVVTVGNTAVGGLVTAVRDTLCLGTPGNLTLSGSNGKIQWLSSTDGINFTSDSTDTLTNYKTNPLLQSTWYYAQLGTGNCGAVSDTLELYVPPALTAFFTDEQNAPHQLTFDCSGSSGNILNYHWDFGDGKTSTEKNPSHAYTKDTTYYICLTLYDGSNCSYTFCRYNSVTDAVQTISATGNWVVFPNPFTNLLSIGANQTNSHMQSIEMYDVLGQLVISKNTGNTTNTSYQLDVSSLAKGMYYVIIRTANADYVQKVVKIGE